MSTKSTVLDATKEASHKYTGKSRLEDPQDVPSLPSLITSFSSNGHPNKLPSRTFTVAFVSLNEEGSLPDIKFTVILRENSGELNSSTRVPDKLFDEKSTSVKFLRVCIDNGILPIIMIS